MNLRLAIVWQLYLIVLSGFSIKFFNCKEKPEKYEREIRAYPEI